MGLWALVLPKVFSCFFSLVVFSNCLGKVRIYAQLLSKPSRVSA